MDFTRTVSSAVPRDRVFFNYNHFNNPISYADESDPNTRFADAFANIPGLSAYASDNAVFKNPTVQYADGTTVWGRGFAGQRVQQADGVLLHTLNRFYGGMVGGDWQAQANLRLGAFVGGGTTRSILDLNCGNDKSDLIFGGLFGRYNWDASFLNVAVQGGHIQTDVTRDHINNNLVAGGLETAKASYDGWYVSPEATYGLHYGLGSLMGASYTLTPSLSLRYLYAWLGGYTETGTTAPLTVNKQTVSDFEERGQLKLTRTQVFGPSAAMMTNIYGGVLGVQRVGSNTVDAVLLGQAIPFATPGKDDVWGGFGGAGLEVRTGQVALFASAEYLALSDNSSVVSGQGGIRVAF
ncbi:MAG: autotransporter outer membrane beta-barrel domain-containing protein [Pseudolabrys sp.]